MSVEISRERKKARSDAQYWKIHRSSFPFYVATVTVTVTGATLDADVAPKRVTIEHGKL